ncbi:anti-sigma factor family protein [Nonomuraea sp. NPDC050790]|uniref:anti-sigma factor family protein n=1 Tax=Nonomuraea sp. NPDC050790 TaxID=3364371 RepID=UPI0037B2E0C0
MMTCEEVRLSLGAHALGALDPEEALEIDTHLATCEACGAELTELEGVTAFLGKVSERDVELVASPPRQVLDRLLNDRAKRSRRGRVLLAVAASAAVLAIGGAVWTSTTGGQGMSSTAAGRERAEQQEAPAAKSDAQPDYNFDAKTSQEPRTASESASESPSAQTLNAPAGKEFKGADGARRATIMAVPAEGGTELNLTVSGVAVGTRCRVIVLGDGNRRETLDGWEVSRENYEKPPVFQLKTKLPLESIRIIRIVDQNGKLLVNTRTGA